MFGLVIFGVIIVVFVVLFFLDKEENNSKQFSEPKAKPTPIEITPEFQKAKKLIYSGCPLIFISGRAGTGKTTLIDWVRKESYIVLAFMGVAALNCKGKTIHRFFRFNIGVLTTRDQIIKKLLPGQERIIKSMKVLIIDEISMVRADLIDAIDKALKHYRETSKPFGGVQLIFVGDMYQLPPICKDKEKKFFKKGEIECQYPTPYFFSAKVFKKYNNIRFIELTKCFRVLPSEIEFHKHLNNLRLFKDKESVCEYFNRQYRDLDDYPDGYVIITPRRKTKTAINKAKLQALSGELKKFYGITSGSFEKIKEDDLPAPKKLLLKKHAFVMFLKNDPDERYVNGSTGIVKSFNESDRTIKVQLTSSNKYIDVKKNEWEDISYRFDFATKKIINETTGYYYQYPLDLAWACTIHKAQGKTIDKVCVDLGFGTWEAGQTYVALSRVRKINDLILYRKLYPEDIQENEKINQLYEKLKKREASKNKKLI